MKIENLAGIIPEPTTTLAWLRLFTLEEQNVIQESMLKGTPAQVHPIVSKLDENPYPFGRDALAKYMKRLKESSNGSNRPNG